MSYEAAINVDGFSCRDWSASDYVAHVWQSLTQSPLNWCRWGTHQPYRRKFRLSSKAEFTQSWVETLSRAFGSMGACVTGSEEEFFVLFFGTHSPKPHPSSFSVHCPSDLWPRESSHLQEMTFRLFSNLECFHGRICHDGEFHGQHYSEKRQPKEGTTRVVMLGVDYRQGIPGVYWGNLFGPPVTEWIGVDRLRSCPCHKHVEFAPGYHMIAAYPDIESFDTPAAVAARDAIREHLGIERFYDRRFPDRETVSPPLDLSELYRPPPESDPAMEAKLKSKARKMGGWLEIQEGEMRLHLEGTPEPEENR